MARKTTRRTFLTETAALGAGLWVAGGIQAKESDSPNEKKVATQMGNQGTAGDSLRHAAAVVQGGHLGTIKEVHVWTNRPIWPQGGPRPKAADKVPETVHWDLFIGPAPFRDYAAGYH